MAQKKCPICQQSANYPEGWENKPSPQNPRGVRYVCPTCADKLSVPETYVSVRKSVLDTCHNVLAELRYARQLSAGVPKNLVIRRAEKMLAEVLEGEKDEEAKQQG